MKWSEAIFSLCRQPIELLELFMAIRAYVWPPDIFRKVAGLFLLQFYYNFGTSRYNIGEKKILAFHVCSSWNTDRVVKVI